MQSYAYGAFTVSLSLTSTGILSGTLTQTEVSGIGTFANLKIESKGIFYLQASSVAKIQDISQELIIGILVIKRQTVQITPNPIYKCQEFIVTVKIFDQFSQLYSNLASIALSSNCAYSNNSFSTSAGTHSFSLYSHEVNTCQLTIESSYSLPESSGSIYSTETVEFLQSQLVFTVSPPKVSFTQEFLTTYLFSLTTCVYGAYPRVLISKYCTFQVDLTLANSTSISGTTSIFTSNGCSVFSNFQILSPTSTSLKKSTLGLNSISSLISISELTIR